MTSKKMILAMLAVTLASCNKTWFSTHGTCESNTELESILQFYEDSSELKQESAHFLVKNMPGHYFYTSHAISSYRNFVVNADTLTSATMRELWDSLRQNNNATKVYDTDILSSEFIRDNIEYATRTWQHTPWHKEMGEEVFLNYVLPYRVMDEPPSCIGWRDSLYNRYHNVIEGIKDVKTAFGKVHKYILNEFQIHDIGDYPYLLSAVDAMHMRTGRCINQSAYMVAVMRSLGIPATLDLIYEWSNFSTNGHAWAALVTAEGTLTTKREDSIARKDNKIDASIFHINDTIEASFPLNLTFKKRVSKIWRYTFTKNDDISTYHDKFANNYSVYKFSNPFMTDVTVSYGFNQDIRIKPFLHSGYAYLCTFKTGDGWQPTAWDKSLIGSFIFHNMPDSVIYLPTYFDDAGSLKAISAPFVMTSRGRKEFKADPNKRQVMRIERKYPFSLISAKSCPQMRGAYIEVSNDINFKRKVILHTFTKTPLFHNEINIKLRGKYRFVRYCTQPASHAYISEIEIYDKSKLLKGKAFGKGISNPEKCFDGDTYSYADNV